MVEHHELSERPETQETPRSEYERLKRMVVTERFKLESLQRQMHQETPPWEKAALAKLETEYADMQNRLERTKASLQSAIGRLRLANEWNNETDGAAYEAWRAEVKNELEK